MSLLQTIKQLYWTVTEQTVPANPDSGDQRLYIDSADHKLKRVNSSGAVTTIEVSASAVNSFETIAVSGQSNVVADSATDTLTLVAGSNVTITTNAGADTITFTAAAGGGGDFLVVQVFS